MRERRWHRIIPIATIMYGIAFINRTNISLALPSMSRELHMNSLQAGTIAGIFFWGYLFFQVPCGYLASRWSTKWIVSILLIIWGCASVGCGLVHTWQELWVMRFLLGVGEGGMYPATLVLLSHWFPSKERARANGWFSLAVPLSLVISSPLSGWLIQKWNWRVMLIVEGLFPLIWLLVWILEIHDYPHQAPWISPEECEFLEASYKRETAAREPARREKYWRSLVAPQVLLLALIKLLMLSGQLGYTFWLPSAIEKARTISSMRTGILNAIPFVVGAISLLYNSTHSDKVHERRAHMAAPMAIGGVALFSGIATMSRWPTLSFALVCVAAIGAFAPLGPFWAVTTEWFSRKMAGSVAGFVNGVGNLGGFFGPLLVGYLNKRFGSFLPGFSMLASFMLIGAVLPFFLKPPPDPAPVRIPGQPDNPA
ncbi:MAG TPA: MFS transporter [Candidatus Dormibacteraeota bacterium]|nr:MFS transporter [Candidatus Dormibacteraeota bacterium]